MKKPVELWNSAKTFGMKNQAELLTIGSVAATWFAIYEAYKAGPKAEKILEAKKKDLEDVEEGDKKTKATVIFEAVKEIVPVVAPAVVLGSMSTACAIGSNKTSREQIVTLSTAYTMASTALREHKEKTREVLGEAKAQQVREAISREHLENSVPPKDDLNITSTGLGTTLCYDEYTDRYFYCSAEMIGKAIVKINRDLQREMWIPLNAFYQELNLRPCKMGEDLGWNVDRVGVNGIPIYYTAILTEGDIPCLCVQFDVDLRGEYY